MPKQLKHGICLLITKTHYRFKLSLHRITQGFCSIMSPYSRDFLKFLYQLLAAMITLIVELITVVVFFFFFILREGLSSHVFKGWRADAMGLSVAQTTALARFLLICLDFPLRNTFRAYLETLFTVNCAAKATLSVLM